MITVPIEVQFLQLQIRIAGEDLNRAKLRLQSLQARMPQDTVPANTNWRVDILKEKK